MKKIVTFLLILTMVFTLAACRSNKPVEDDNNGVNNGTENNDTNNNAEKPPIEDGTASLKLYFANREYILTGDDSSGTVVSVDKKVKVDNKSVEEVIVEELQKQPEDESLTTIVDKITILGVETRDRTAYVDISGENLSGGSLEEALILQQIVLSLTELENVDQVQFLVDGNKRESLMGHIIIDEPLRGADIE